MTATTYGTQLLHSVKQRWMSCQFARCTGCCVCRLIHFLSGQKPFHVIRLTAEGDYSGDQGMDDIINTTRKKTGKVHQLSQLLVFLVKEIFKETKTGSMSYSSDPPNLIERFHTTSQSRLAAEQVCSMLNQQEERVIYCYTLLCWSL
ncbi:uncharacterized protein [Argopecten irradians]|uniref:uncharacterized protein n=1 Tax=Argopecten irradians TaxID=31199 RepID=UPI00371043C7